MTTALKASRLHDADAVVEARNALHSRPPVRIPEAARRAAGMLVSEYAKGRTPLADEDVVQGELRRKLSLLKALMSAN